MILGVIVEVIPRRVCFPYGRCRDIAFEVLHACIKVNGRAALKPECLPKTRESYFFGLLKEYFQLTDNPSKLKDLLKLIKRREDQELFELISNNIEKHEWGLVASNLLSGHYDPAYKKSFERSGELKIFEISQSDCSDTSITFSAEKIISNLKQIS